MLVLSGSVGFVAGGIWMVTQGKSFGWVAILFFGCGLPISIWQIADSRPGLIIDDYGVLDRTMGVGRIAWGDIEKAYVRSISGSDFICFELRDPEKYRQKLSKVKRAMTGANRSLGFTDFNVNLVGVDVGTDEMFELIIKRCHLIVDEQQTNSLKSTPQ